MTKVHKVAVEPIARSKDMGGAGFGVFVYADRNGRSIKTCAETSGDKAAMIKRATAHAKRLNCDLVVAA